MRISPMFWPEHETFALVWAFPKIEIDGASIVMIFGVRFGKIPEIKER